MNKIIKISVVVTLALIIALFAGCGKKKPAKENESSIRTDGFLNEIFGDDFDDGDDSSNKTHEDIVDAGALDALESGSASTNNSSEANSSKNNTSSSSSNNESSSKNQSSSKNESTTSSKNEVTSSKNESSSSKNESSSNASTTSSKNTVSTDNDSTIYTPGWS